jgi:ferric-dicitrate binding protein FerR (iron transport regulator)
MNKEHEHIAPIERLIKFFANETSNEENLWVKKWRDSSPENLKEFNAIKKLWDITGNPSTQEPIDIDKEWNILKNTTAPIRTIRFKSSRIIAIAASVAVITILSIVGTNMISKTVNKTDIAEVKEVELPDGSVINLNAKSKISFKDGFGTEHRNIKLTGEAFFNVAANKDIPFVIDAKEATIEVVGTQFNIKAYKNQKEIKVTVSEGVVRLSNTKASSKQVLINAGETGKYIKYNKNLEKIEAVNQNDIAWRTRILFFKDTPLLEVAKILSNTYHMEIYIDEKIKMCPITVSFKDKDISDVLNIIISTFNLQMTQSDEKIIITGQGCNPS